MENKPKTTAKKISAKKKATAKKQRQNGGRRPAWTQKQMIEAITANHGFLTFAAKSLGCHYHTIQNYINKYPEVAAAYQDIMERKLDIAENVVFSKITEGSETAAQWFLRYKGKHRGYVDKDNTDFHENTLVSDVPKTPEVRKLGIDYLRGLTNEKS